MCQNSIPKHYYTHTSLGEHMYLFLMGSTQEWDCWVISSKIFSRLVQSASLLLRFTLSPLFLVCFLFCFVFLLFIIISMLLQYEKFFQLFYLLVSLLDHCCPPPPPSLNIYTVEQKRIKRTSYMHYLAQEADC